MRQFKIFTVSLASELLVVLLCRGSLGLEWGPWAPGVEQRKFFGLVFPFGAEYS